MYIKKFLITILIISLITVNYKIVYANEEEDALLAEEVINEINLINASTNLKNDPQINSRAAIIYDRKSKEVIWSKNKDDIRKMASTTKIMTAIVVLEKCNLTEVVTVSQKAAGTGGSRLGLKKDDKISVHDLLYGLLLVSGNDAAVQLAEYTAGSIEEFANLMNQKAKQLGLQNTNFVTPHGLDSEQHYTTAYELALITDYALENEKFADIVNTKNYTVTINNYPKTLSNTNELLRNLNGVNGVKTGFTNGANRCLVTSVKRDNMNIITVVLGADTKKFRTSDSIKLIEYAYKNYKTVSIKKMVSDKYEQWKQENENNIFLNKGKISTVDTILEEYEKEYITIKNTEENDINVQIENEKYIETPIEKNQIIGKVRIFVNEEEKLTINILNKELIQRKNVLDFYVQLFKNNWNMMEQYNQC